MKTYPEGTDFWWTVGEMAAIVCVYFIVQFAISAESIVWMIQEAAR